MDSFNPWRTDNAATLFSTGFTMLDMLFPKGVCLGGMVYRLFIDRLTGQQAITLVSLK